MIDSLSFRLGNYDIHFEWILGAQNFSADCMYYLVKLGLTKPLSSEEEGYEHGRKILHYVPQVKPRINKVITYLVLWLTS